MRAFIVECLNKPGELARVTQAVAARGINLISSSTIAWGDKGAIGFLTNDEPGTQGALDQAGIAYRAVETVNFGLADQPGTLADASRRLADAGVNIEFLVPVAIGGSRITIAAAVDNVPAAQQPAATDCPTAIKNLPANGRVIFGDEYSDTARTKGGDKPKLPPNVKGFTDLKPTTPPILPKRPPQD